MLATIQQSINETIAAGRHDGYRRPWRAGLDRPAADDGANRGRAAAPVIGRTA